MGLGFDFVDEIWQGDVNNYVFRFDSGKLERKGSYVKELDDLDNDLPIVNEAIVKYLTENIEPADTINFCNEMIKFQKVVKISGKYRYGMHNGKVQTDKTYRVFASLDASDSGIYKVKTEGAKPEKFANTPEHCFIENGEINGKGCSPKLNKDWYIALASKRLREKFGVKLKGEYEQLELEFAEQKKARAKKQPPEKRVMANQDEMDIF